MKSVSFLLFDPDIAKETLLKIRDELLPDNLFEFHELTKEKIYQNTRTIRGFGLSQVPYFDLAAEMIEFIIVDEGSFVIVKRFSFFNENLDSPIEGSYILENEKLVEDIVHQYNSTVSDQLRENIQPYLNMDIECYQTVLQHKIARYIEWSFIGEFTGLRPVEITEEFLEDWGVEFINEILVFSSRNPILLELEDSWRIVINNMIKKLELEECDIKLELKMLEDKVKDLETDYTVELLIVLSTRINLLLEGRVYKLPNPTRSILVKKLNKLKNRIYSSYSSRRKYKP